MRFFRTALIKDLRRLRRDPVGLIMSAGIPLVVALLLKLAFGGDSAPTAQLLVADHDQSAVSGLLSSAFTQGPLAEQVTLESVTEDVGRARIQDGDGSALLIIPEGFGDAVLQNTPTTLELIRNPAQSILPLMIEEILSVVVDGVFYAQVTVGDALRPMLQAPAGGAATFQTGTVLEVVNAVNSTIGDLSPYLFPPVLSVETETVDTSATAGLDFGTLFLPGLLLMGVLFGAQGMSADIWKEVEGGTLRRMVSSPASVAGFLGGKTGAGFLFAGVLGAAGLLAGRFVFGVAMHGTALALLWAAATGAVLFLMFLLLQLFSTGSRGGNVITGAVVFPLAMAGGSFFPFEAMPDWLAAIGKWTPNGWALVVFKSILRGDADPGLLLRNTALLLGMGTLLFLICHRRLLGGFSRRTA